MSRNNFWYRRRRRTNCRRSCSGWSACACLVLSMNSRSVSRPVWTRSCSKLLCRQVARALYLPSFTLEQDCLLLWCLHDEIVKQYLHPLSISYDETTPFGRVWRNVVVIHPKRSDALNYEDVAWYETDILPFLGFSLVLFRMPFNKSWHSYTLLPVLRYFRVVCKSNFFKFA